MQADRRDRVGSNSEERSRHGTQAIIMVIVAVILAGGALLLLPGDDEPEAPAPVVQESAPAVVKAPTPDPAENIRQAPDIPEPEPEPVAEVEETPEVAVAPEPEPEPPSPEEIDAMLRDSAAAAGAEGGALAPALAAPFLLDRGVSAIDQVARGYVPLRALNIARPAGKYEVRREGMQHFVDERSYQRYDGIVDSITALNPEQLAAAFQRHRELFEDGYAALGYPGDAVDNALVAALDTIIAAPVLREPLALTSKGALWAYADPALEARSDVDKQLMRLGPDNLEVLQRWAQDLRNALLQ